MLEQGEIIETVRAGCVVAHVLELKVDDRVERAFTFWRWLVPPNDKKATRTFKANHRRQLLQMLDEIESALDTQGVTVGQRSDFRGRQYPLADTAVVHRQQFGDVVLTVHETKQRWFLLRRLVTIANEQRGSVVFYREHIPGLRKAVIASAEYTRRAD